MGRSAEAAAETRRNIVTTASAEFRKNGFANVGLADLMAQLGLTHGGFYRHFANKDQLVAEACQDSFDKIILRFPKNGTPHTLEALSHIASRYLSAKERDNPEISCVFASVGNDLVRSSDSIRDVATEGFREFVSLLEKALPECEDAATAAQEATTAACSLIGTLMMARLVTDKKLSNQLLNTGKEQLLKTYEEKYTAAAKLKRALAKQKS